MAEYIVGRLYKVQCVLWHGLWFPTLGTPHADPELLGHRSDKDEVHVHLDWRFVGPELAKLLAKTDPTSVIWAPKEGFRFEVKRKKCVRAAHAVFPALTSGGRRPEAFFDALYRQLQGKSLNLDKMVCPHKGISLEGVAPDSEGCVVCPGHGARWDLATGELKPRTEWKGWLPPCMREVPRG